MSSLLEDSFWESEIVEQASASDQLSAGSLTDDDEDRLEPNFGNKTSRFEVMNEVDLFQGQGVVSSVPTSAHFSCEHGEEEPEAAETLTLLGRGIREDYQDEEERGQLGFLSDRDYGNDEDEVGQLAFLSERDYDDADYQLLHSQKREEEYFALDSYTQLLDRNSEADAHLDPQSSGSASLSPSRKRSQEPTALERVVKSRKKVSSNNNLQSLSGSIKDFVDIRKGKLPTLTPRLEPESLEMIESHQARSDATSSSTRGPQREEKEVKGELANGKETAIDKEVGETNVIPQQAHLHVITTKGIQSYQVVECLKNRWNVS